MTQKPKNTKAESLTLDVKTVILIAAIVVSSVVNAMVNKQSLEKEFAVDHAVLERIEKDMGTMKKDIEKDMDTLHGEIGDVKKRVKSLEGGYIRIETKMEAWTR